MSYPGEVPVAPALSPEPPLQPAGPAGFLSPQTTGLPQSRFNNGPLWRPSLPLHPATSRAAILTHMLTPPESSSHCARGGFLLHPEFSLVCPCLDPLSCPTSGFKLQIRSWWAKPVQPPCPLSSPAPASRPVLCWLPGPVSPSMAGALGTVGPV